jgi:hypothetical protein
MSTNVVSLGHVSTLFQEDPEKILAILNQLGIHPILTIDGIAHYDQIEIRTALQILLAEENNSRK